MLYRKAIDWPIGNDDDPHAIVVTFVRESAHGDPFVGADNDGETLQVTISDRALDERLTALAAKRTVGEPSPLSYPSLERTELFADIYALAERDLVAQGEDVAGAALSAFVPKANIETIAEVDDAIAMNARFDRGEPLDES